MDSKKKKDGAGMKQFLLTSASINNRKTVLLITAIIFFMGIGAYTSMPKEYFPELQMPEIYVSTPYPGSNSQLVRDDITDPFENEINAIKNVDEITSTSVDGFSMIKIKFDFKVSPDDALAKVKTAVEDARAKPDFPQLQIEPKFIKADVSDMPMLNVNLSSNLYSAEKLEEYGKVLKKAIKALPEVSDVIIRGVPEKKVIIEVNRAKMTASQVGFGDIEGAIESENVNLPSGELLSGGRKVTLKIDNEFTRIQDFDSLIVKSEDLNEIYLKDITDSIYFGDADATSFARQYDETVVMLDVKKRSGQNLLVATDKIHKIVQERAGIPNSVKITTTNELASKTKDGVSNLENSIIFGVILVVLVLLFFLGLRNALFVGMAIPLSMFMSFMILNALGVSLNVMVLFSSVLALGMLVDNGIVVVENIYRLMDEGYSPINAAKYGVGEVAWPIIASTATTLAAFVPLAFWPGMMGEFMKYLPITLIIILGSSLFVALVINPVFTALWMRVEEKKTNKKRLFIITGIALILGVMLVASGTIAWGNLFLLIGIFILINMYIFKPGTRVFQNKVLPKLENSYSNFLSKVLVGKRPGFMLLGTFGLLVLSGMLIGTFPPNTIMFPENQPNYVNIYVEHPVGTDIYKTDSTTREVYAIVDSVLSEKRELKRFSNPTSYNEVYNDAWEKDDEGTKTWKKEFLIKSVISQVGKGTSDPANGQPEVGESPHKGRITVQFAEAQYRSGVSTADVMDDISEALEGQFAAGIRVIVDKNMEGPPQPPLINIEVTGPLDYYKTIEYAEALRKFCMQDKYLKEYPELKEIVELRLDVETGKLELPIELDGQQLRQKGSSTIQAASMIRTSLFGKDMKSTYPWKGDSYKINVRISNQERNNLDALLNQEIVFRNTKGKLINIPLISLQKSKQPTIYSTYGSVIRKDLEDVVTLYTKLKHEDQADKVIASLKVIFSEFEKTEMGKSMVNDGYGYEFTGGKIEQEKEMAFLSTALGIAVFLILLIIVTQFNSFSTPAIILTSVILSLIGVLLGLVIFRQDFVVMMTMIGIISLAGVVVNNAIVLIDYTNLIRKRKREEFGLDETQLLPMKEVIDSIIEGGRTRLRPVLLTAITTVLGLIPLAAGLNINFVTLFTDYDAQIFIGGDNAVFFGPMSWTIIYGLSFATFLTLVIVPVTYLLLYRLKIWIYKLGNWELKSNIK